MQGITLKQILDCCQGQYVGKKEDLDKEVTGIEIDSRKIQPGNLFVPIKGERADGHNYISQVMEAGALASLTEQPLGESMQNIFFLLAEFNFC